MGIDVIDGGRLNAVEQAAVTLYATLDKNSFNFINMITAEKNNDVLNLLYEILTFEPEILDEKDRELNKIGAKLVKSELEKRKNGLLQISEKSN